MRALLVVAALVASPAVAFEEVDCVVEAPEPAEPLMAVKLLGGGSGVVNTTSAKSDQPGLSGMLGVEVRLTEWLAVRSDLDLRANGVSWDVAGLKLRGPWFLSPYFSVSATVGLTGGHFSLGPVGAAGLDLRLGRHFFLELEGAFRVSPGETLRRAGQVSVMAGLGYAFF